MFYAVTTTYRLLTAAYFGHVYIHKDLYLVTGLYVSVSVCRYVFNLVGCELGMAGARNTGGRYELQLM